MYKFQVLDEKGLFFQEVSNTDCAIPVLPSSKQTNDPFFRLANYILSTTVKPYQVKGSYVYIKRCM